MDQEFGKLRRKRDIQGVGKMGNSLADQLLKAGLVDEKQAQAAERDKAKAKRQQNKQPKAVRKKNKPKPKPSPEQLAKQAKDKELNERRNAARKQKEIAAQIKQLVEGNRYPPSDPEQSEPFYFENKGKIKSLYISEPTRKMLGDGRLKIVNANGVFELVPPEIAEKIRERNPSMVIDLPEEQSAEEDDPYAAYEVPDDLMW